MAEFSPAQRCWRIDIEVVDRLLDVPIVEQFRCWEYTTVRERLAVQGTLLRQAEWTASIAVAEETYFADVNAELGLSGCFRTVDALREHALVLRERKGTCTAQTHKEGGNLSECDLITSQKRSHSKNSPKE